MSFGLPEQRMRHQPRVRWQAAAFLVEAMILVLFIMASLAVLTLMYAQAAERSVQGDNLTEAVSLAISTAERFSADPTAISERVEKGEYIVQCDVVPERRSAGVMYKANISVYKRAGENTAPNSPLYAVSTCKYVGEV